MICSRCQCRKADFQSFSIAKEAQNLLKKNHRLGVLKNVVPSWTFPSKTKEYGQFQRKESKRGLLQFKDSLNLSQLDDVIDADLQSRLEKLLSIDSLPKLPHLGSQDLMRTDKCEEENNEKLNLKSDNSIIGDSIDVHRDINNDDIPYTGFLEQIQMKEPNLNPMETVETPDDIASLELTSRTEIEDEVLDSQLISHSHYEKEEDVKPLTGTRSAKGRRKSSVFNRRRSSANRRLSETKRNMLPTKCTKPTKDLNDPKVLLESLRETSILPLFQKYTKTKFLKENPEIKFFEELNF